MAVSFSTSLQLSATRTLSILLLFCFSSFFFLLSPQQAFLFLFDKPSWKRNHGLRSSGSVAAHWAMATRASARRKTAIAGKKRREKIGRPVKKGQLRCLSCTGCGMNSAQYDEDLYANTFFRLLQSKHKTLWKHVQEQRLLVCLWTSGLFLFPLSLTPVCHLPLASSPPCFHLFASRPWLLPRGPLSFFPLRSAAGTGAGAAHGVDQRLLAVQGGL